MYGKYQMIEAESEGGFECTLVCIYIDRPTARPLDRPPNRQTDSNIPPSNFV